MTFNLSIMIYGTKIWLDILGYEQEYMICNLGVIRSIKKKNFWERISTRVDRAGYETVRLSKNGKSATFFMHRLLATLFLPNPENKKYVNHKNGNQLDNHLENLEWVTHSENILHGYEIGLIKSRPVINKCSGEEYVSIKKAASENGINPNKLKRYLSGKIKSNPTCLEYKNVA